MADQAMVPIRRRAYAILAGGGVKGVALVGCLVAAQELGFSFDGYAGTSAGSMVSLLACIGYSGREIAEILEQHPVPSAFLDSESSRLTSFVQNLQRSGPVLGTMRNHVNTFWVLRTLSRNLGICSGIRTRQLLTDLVQARLPAHAKRADEMTFDDLRRGGYPLLKVIASDISRRAAHVYSSGPSSDPQVVIDSQAPIVSAVRASISYPIMFQPVTLYDRRLVDGGLTANLPFFLFEEEQRVTRLPAIAFDLIAPRRDQVSTYGLGQFIRDLSNTALEAAQRLHRDRFRNVYLVQVEMPEDVDAFTAVSPAQHQELFRRGYDATKAYLTESSRPWVEARSRLQWLQALYAPPHLVRPILEAYAREIETLSPARNLRVSVTLPTGDGTRVVAYQHGMDDDPDRELELAIDAGCSGAAWSTRQPAWADLQVARESFATEWKLTEEQQSRIPADRQAMFSIPLFETRFGDRHVHDLAVLGVLSIDTDTPFHATLWYGEKRAVLLNRAKVWADIVVRALR